MMHVHCEDNDIEYDFHHRACHSSRYTLEELYEMYSGARDESLISMASDTFAAIFALTKSVVPIEVQCWFCPNKVDH